MKIPVEVQKPNKPQSALFVGEADDRLSVEEVAKLVGVPDGCLIDGKIMGGRKKPRRWSLVAYVEFVTAMLALAVISMPEAFAQESHPSRPRYYYGGEPHIGPATAGTFYDANGRPAGRTYTDTQGSATMYDNSGRVMGRTATDSQGTTTYYDAGGRKTGTAVPNGNAPPGRR